MKINANRISINHMFWGPANALVVTLSRSLETACSMWERHDPRCVSATACFH